MESFVKTSSVMAALQRSVLGGAKIPHTVSYPVLRKVDGAYCLAVFVQTYDKALLQKKAVRRPSYWYLADLTTGSPLRELDCRKEDFCSAPFDRLYRRGEAKKQDLTKADVEGWYAQLDEIRKHLLTDGVPDVMAYRAYLDQIFEAVPSGQINFYRELSSLK